MDDERSGERQSVLRETDDAARELADRLMRGARHAALGVMSAASGFPEVSRVLVATDCAGTPIILASGLSAHTKSLLNDERCSLLFGEPGKGDPLAHARMTVLCRAQAIDQNAVERAVLRRRFLARHPKAELYIDFPDFRFFRLIPSSASLNGGFGRAYSLSAGDFAVDPAVATELGEIEERAVGHMNEDHLDAIDAYARAFASEKTTGWHMTGVDPVGFEIAKGDGLRRIRFPEPLRSAQDLRPALVSMAKDARAIN